MKWKKMGRVYSPEPGSGWLSTHGMLPVADLVGGDVYRVYFSGRDDQNRSRIGWVVIDIARPTQILDMACQPCLDIGELGAFDDNGVTPTWIVNSHDKKLMYYFGWNTGGNVRAAEVSGLAMSYDGGLQFERVSRAPVIDRSDDEPFLVLVISCVIVEDGLWRMWYDSADFWISRYLPRYRIKYAESHDGIHWIRTGRVSVDYKSDYESRVSRACVLREEGVYKMWFCHADGLAGYRLGYGESADGVEYERNDAAAGIDVSDEGWDSEMVCYPYVLKHDGHHFMFYCGNGYGRTGFGCAVLE